MSFTTVLYDGSETLLFGELQVCDGDAELAWRCGISIKCRIAWTMQNYHVDSRLQWWYEVSMALQVAMTLRGCDDDMAMTTNEYNHEYLWMRLFMNKTTSSTVASSSNDTNSKRWMANAEWQMENNEREITNKALKDPVVSEFRWLKVRTRNCHVDAELFSSEAGILWLAGCRRIAMNLRECNGCTVLRCSAEFQWSGFTIAM